MKKILGIIFLSIYLIGCTQTPEKIIERCADKEHDFFPDTKILKKQFEEKPKWKRINTLKSKYRWNKKVSEKRFKTYAFGMFNITEEDMRITTNIIVKNTLAKKDENYSPEKFPKYLFFSSIKEPENLTEAVLKVEELFNTYQIDHEKYDQIFTEAIELTDDIFYKLKLRDKLLDKKYEYTFMRCEAKRTQSPLAFDSKWK